MIESSFNLNRYMQIQQNVTMYIRSNNLQHFTWLLNFHLLFFILYNIKIISKQL